MYKLTEQSVTEARRDFTKNLKMIAADDAQETVVLVRNRGEPVAGIISAVDPEFSHSVAFWPTCGYTPGSGT